MQLPILYVKQLLEADADVKSLVSKQPIYMVSVDEKYQKKESLPIVRVNQISGNHSTFVSNQPYQYDIVIQVDVWSESFEKISPFHETLDKVFINDGWSCVYSEITKDPDFNNYPRIIKRYHTKQNIDFN